jgi:cis-3-alkyl-4-acyloxetan-2-one decarboxylase
VKIIDTVWHRLLKRPYRLAALESGSGSTVVLLHGLAASSQVWQPLITRLTKNHWHVVAPDLLGFGKSPKPAWNSYDVEQHARMVIALLASKRKRGKVIIVGHSMGCLVAVHIAARYPQLVSRLVLFEPPLFADNPDYRSHSRRREQYFALFSYAVAHPQWAFMQSPLLKVMRRITGLSLDQDTWLPFERSLRNTIMQQRAYDDLRAMATPTTIIHGRLDFVVIRTELKRMFAANPAITMRTVTDLHGLSQRSLRYISNLLDSYKTTKPTTKRKR